jgi:hypothetical protein
LIAPGAKNAKTMIWLPLLTGSILPGRWVEQGSAQTVAFRHTGYFNRETVQKTQEHMIAGH